MFVCQKFDADCVVACLAMLLGVEYEEIAAQCLGHELVKFGVPDSKARKICAMFKIKLDDALHPTVMDWSKPAILTVPSLNQTMDGCTNGTHAIYWDGKRVWDPQKGRKGRKTYTNQRAREYCLYGQQKTEGEP